MTDYDDQNSSEYKDQTTETTSAEQTGQQISSPADGEGADRDSCGPVCIRGKRRCERESSDRRRKGYSRGADLRGC